MAGACVLCHGYAHRVSKHHKAGRLTFRQIISFRLYVLLRSISLTISWCRPDWHLRLYRQAHFLGTTLKLESDQQYFAVGNDCYLARVASGCFGSTFLPLSCSMLTLLGSVVRTDSFKEDLFISSHYEFAGTAEYLYRSGGL